MKFSERLKEMRTALDLSQMDLAKATGLSQSAIAKWELNKTEPTMTALITLSRFFNESIDYLVGLTE